MNTPPVISIVISPKTANDAERLAGALERLTAEDVRLCVSNTGAPSQVDLRGVSEQHLEQTIDRLKREFAVNASLSLPRVLYREGITRAADGEWKHARQVSGGGEYAHVKIRIAPRPPSSGRVVENTVVGGAIPGEFMAAVERGIREALDSGSGAGHPIEDVSVDVFGGSYHDQDSSEAAFAAAAHLAVQNAVRTAEPVLMEPVLRVVVVAPPEFASDVQASLVRRRGQLLPAEGGGEAQVIRALVPVAGLFAYDHELRHRTGGHATYTAEFETYVPVVRPDDKDDGAGIGVRRRPSPSPRDSAIALPEPDDVV